MESVERSNPLKFTSAQLKLYTNNFDEENLIGLTQFGKLYRGKIPHGLDEAGVQNVTLKILGDSQWECPSVYLPLPADTKSKFRDELHFLQTTNVKNHPNVAKLMGYCCEGGVFAIIYDLNPLDTLHNLILQDNFDWPRRIKVALGFARLLAFLHQSEFPYMVRNIDVAHIMIDKDFNPILVDFGMLSGGPGDVANRPYQACCEGGWLFKRDGYLYGILVLSIIAKRLVDKAFTKETVDEWANIELKPKRPKRSFFSGQKKCSLVHKSLEEDPNYDARDGPKITELAARCLEYYPQRRPTMKEIVEVLQDLQAVRKHIEPKASKLCFLMLNSQKKKLPVSLTFKIFNML